MVLFCHCIYFGLTANQTPYSLKSLVLFYRYAQPVGWLVVFNVPSTARSFRDGTPPPPFTVPCEGREAR